MLTFEAVHQKTPIAAGLDYEDALLFEVKEFQKGIEAGHDAKKGVVTLAENLDLTTQLYLEHYDGEFDKLKGHPKLN